VRLSANPEKRHIAINDTKKKLSSLKIRAMQMLKTTRKVMMHITSRTMRMKKKMHEIDLTKIT